MHADKYAHLKIELLKGDYKYALFSDGVYFTKAIESLIIQKEDFCSFSFRGEYSLVCSSELVLENVLRVQEGWSAMKIVGDMPFGTVQGLIANISSSLYKADLGVCIVSTFQTDIFFLKKVNVVKAKKSLSAAGWEIIE